MTFAVFSEKLGAIGAESEGLIVCHDYIEGRMRESPASL